MTLISNIKATWNNALTTFSAIKMNVTDTASASDSKLIDLQVDGVSKFSVNKEGKVTNQGGNSFIFDTYADLKADTTLTTTNTPVGTIVEAQGFRYQAVASGGDITTAGGVQFEVQMLEGRYPAEASGFSTSETAANNGTILRTMLNKGPVSVGAGTFPLDAFEFNDNDDLWGAGPETVFTSSSGIVMALGSIKGDSFNATGQSTRYALNAVTEGDTSVTLTTAGDAANFAVGEKVAIYSDNGYTNTSGNFKPSYQQITKITAISSGILTLNDATYRDGTGNMQITRGPDVTNSAGIGNGITEKLHVGNFTVVSTADSWSRYGGTYRSVIGPIFIEDSSSAIVLNGLSHSKIVVPRAKFRRHLLDLAFFSHNSMIEFGVWEDDIDSTNAGMPLITFAEACHDNHVFAGNGYAARNEQRSDVVLVSSGSVRNTLEAGSVGAANVLNVIKAERRASSVMEEGRTSILSGSYSAKASNQCISHAATTYGERVDLFIGGGVSIKSDANTTNQLVSTASGLIFKGLIDADGDVVINTASRDIDLSNARFKRQPGTITIGASAGVNLSGVYWGEGVNIDHMAANIGVGSASSSTTFFSRYDKTADIGAWLDNDSLEINIFGSVAGTAAGKRIRIKLNGGYTGGGDFLMQASTVGNFHVRGVVQMVALTAQRVYLHGSCAGVDLQTKRQQFSINTAITAIQVEIGGLVDNAADSITIEHVQVTPKRSV